MASIEAQVERLAARAGADLTARERAAYRLTRAGQVAAGDLSGPSLEREVSDAITRHSGQSARGVWVPLDVGAPSAVLEAGTATAGAEFLQVSPLLPLLDLLRARSITGVLGARMETVRFPVALPRQAGDVSTEWIEESPATPVGDSTPATSRVPLELHTLVATVPATRQFLVESVTGEAYVRNALAGGIAAELDRVAIQGAGGSSAEPLGILNTAGISVVAIAADGGPVTYAHVTELEEAVSAADADGTGDVAGALGFVSTPAVRRALRQTEKAAGSGVVWADNTMLGHRAIVSTNVPSDLTKGSGTNLHALLFGNWRELVVATAGALDIVADPVSLKKRGLFEITAFLHADVAPEHAEAFAAIVDVDPSA